MAGPAAKDNPNAGSDPAAARGAVRDPLPAGFAVVTLGKFLSNVAFRLVFPFLPRIAGGLGVSLGAMGTALAVREFAGLANPALGRAADRRGHGLAMTVGLLGLAAALLLQGVASGLVLFTVGLVVLTLAKSLFDVAAGAWVGEEVPYTARGRAMGLLETSWAMAFVVAMPIAALVIRGTTWRMPFLVVAGMCVIMAAFTDASPAGTGPTRSPERLVWTTALRAGIATFVLMGIGHSMMLVTFASWLEDQHGASIGGLGLTAFVIGVAELGGSIGAATFADRIGLSRALSASLALGGAASVLLIVGNSAFGLALATMVLYFVLAEFSIVVLLSLFSEFDQTSRGRAMGLAFAAFAVGHAAGAVAGTQIYEASGMNVNVIIMGATFVAAALPVWWFLDDRGHEPDRAVT